MMREYTGRGPLKARTTIRDNVVLVMLEQTLMKGEQVFVDKGRTENVLALRHEYQEAMRDESSEKVAELTGRGVIAMMSAGCSVFDHLSSSPAVDRGVQRDVRAGRHQQISTCGIGAGSRSGHLGRRTPILVRTPAPILWTLTTHTSAPASIAQVGSRSWKGRWALHASSTISGCRAVADLHVASMSAHVP
jgi:hypothetical protein